MANGLGTGSDGGNTAPPKPLEGPCGHRVVRPRLQAGTALRVVQGTLLAPRGGRAETSGEGRAGVATLATGGRGATMSRGPGVRQRQLLEALASQEFVRLGGVTRSATVALKRAARALDRAGRCVVLRLWDEDRHGRRVLRLFAFPPRPDGVRPGRPSG